MINIVSYDENTVLKFEKIFEENRIASNDKAFQMVIKNDVICYFEFNTKKLHELTC